MANRFQVRRVNGKQARPALFAVLVEGKPEPVGMLEKWPDGGGPLQPWKSYRDFGFEAEYLGAFYPSDGGRRAALESILGK